MTTKLDKPLKRKIQIGGKPFVVTISPDGFKLVGKGRRKGLEISWESLVSGEAAMAIALKASLTANFESSRRGKSSARRKTLKVAAHRRKLDSRKAATEK